MRADALKDLLLVGLEVLDAAQGSVLLADAEGTSLEFAVVASRGELARHESEFVHLIGRKVSWGEGVSGRAAALGLPQVATKGDAVDFCRVANDGSPGTVLAVPMIGRDGKVLGVITAVSFDRIREFDPDACRLYARVASVAAALVEDGRAKA